MDEGCMLGRITRSAKNPVRRRAIAVMMSGQRPNRPRDRDLLEADLPDVRTCTPAEFIAELRMR